ncbi:MAG TPA: ammonia channel protein [Verrucomicrobiales bacterium]|nr:ammonia channel protein [Verrucomicrobiales bacterium]
MKKLLTTLTLSLSFMGGFIASAEESNSTEPPPNVYSEVTDDNGTVVGKGESWSESTGSSGDTAWMIVATALVLFMTIPGLSLFYGGLARRKNVLSILVQCFAITALMTLLWTIYGYSMAATGSSEYLGGFDKAFLKGVGSNTLYDGEHTIPESVYFTFQMTFAIITPALIVGAFAERMKFSAVMVFVAIWFTLSYLPIWHMAWGGGLFHGGKEGNWLMGAGEAAADFAGGTVVHVNAGIAGLVACILLGARKGFGKENMPPHNVPLVVIGASMLWVGWFGFNAGSQLAADGTAGMALMVTQIATAAAAFTWMIIEWYTVGKPTAVGVATGAVAGLVAITPACGTVGPMAAIAIGFASGAVCYWAATALKKKLGYDDSFDVFGVHGVGGIVGALLTGCFAVAAIDVTNAGGVGESFSLAGVWTQAKAVIFTIFWSAVVSFIALKIAGALCGGIRSDEDSETQGLDVNDHGEEGYQL